MIEIKQLNKFFNKGKENEIHVINDVSLDLPEKGMVAIFGKSGCGKTTLLNVIGGLDGFSEGSLRIEGNDIKKSTDTIRNKYIGYIFQNYNLNKFESSFENVADALRIAGMTDEEEIEKRVNAALFNVGMEKYAKRNPDTLSGGQQQRIAIARAIVKNPKIILADEPTGNLDEANTVMIMNLLKAISKDHLVLLVTHEANLVDYYCDKVIELSDGKIVNIKDNNLCQGYVAKDKNDIYLGELECSEFSSDNTEIKYYGDSPKESIKLTIVNKNGQIYLKVDTDKIHILDDFSEVKLKEGVFEEKAGESLPEEKIDMSSLPPIETSGEGKLFTFKSSVKSAFKSNFRTKKRSNKILYACMCLFAAVTVIMSSIFGTAFKKLIEASDAYNHNVFYVYATSEDVSKKLNNAINNPDTGIDYITLGDWYSKDTDINFSIANFETFQSSPYNMSSAYSTNVVYLGLPLAKDLKLVAGKKETLKDEEIIITTKVADELLEKSVVGYIDEYEDLLGLCTQYTGFSVDGKSLRIAGIVESKESSAYLSDVAMMNRVQMMGFTSYSASSDKYGLEVNSGETVLAIHDEFTNNDQYPKIGEKIKIQGSEFTVTDIIYYCDPFNYPIWEKREALGKMTVDEYLHDLTVKTYPELSTESEEFAARLAEITNSEYFTYYDYYYSHFSQFLKECYLNSSYQTFDLWLYAVKGIDEMKAVFFEFEYRLALEYKEEYGRYPTKEEYVLYSPSEDFNEDSMVKYYNLYETEFQYLDMYYPGPCTYYVNSADYNLFSKQIGDTHPTAKAPNANRYTVIHSYNPDATERWLNEEFGDIENYTYSDEYGYSESYDFIVTPDEVRKEHVSIVAAEIISSVISIVVILAVMSVCMYFIMRSSLMNRIKEVGIYRAIGVSKKNLLFKFLIESIVLTVCTVFVGFLLTSLFVYSCLNSSKLVADIFFYPFWFALIDLLVLFSLSTICGILPIFSLLRKTPSEILSKYDI